MTACRSDLQRTLCGILPLDLRKIGSKFISLVLRVDFRLCRLDRLDLIKRGDKLNYIFNGIDLDPVHHRALKRVF